jgi:hypothetical protein
LQDDPFDRQDPSGDTSTGVLFADGSRKPAYTAFRFPFVTERTSEKKLIAWGKSPAAGKLVIQRKRRKGWIREAMMNVRVGAVFKTTLKLRGPQKLRAVVDGERSLVWTQR